MHNKALKLTDFPFYSVMREMNNNHSFVVLLRKSIPQKPNLQSTAELNITQEKFMSNNIISIAVLILIISGCTSNKDVPSWYPLNSCYVGALNFEKEGAVNHLTICLKNNNKVTANLRYSNQSSLHGRVDKPTICSSEGEIKQQDKESKFVIITEKGRCTNGRSFNSFSINCELSNTDSLMCRNNQFPNEINLTRVQ